MWEDKKRFSERSDQTAEFPELCQVRLTQKVNLEVDFLQARCFCSNLTNSIRVLNVKMGSATGEPRFAWKMLK